MEKVTGKVRLQYQKVRYYVGYEVDRDGVITLDKSGLYPAEVYEKVMDKVWEQRLSEYVGNPDELVRNDGSDILVTLNDEEPKKESNPFQEVFEEDLLRRLEELEQEKEALEQENQRLRERKVGGRPSIGETRKASLTLPDWIWKDIDNTVQSTGIKQSAFLRDLIMEGYEQHVLAMSQYKGGVKDEQKADSGSN